MFKACSRCGKVHDTKYKCRVGVKKYSYKESVLRNTHDWHKKSEQIRADSRYLCAICEDKGIFNTNNLEVHHIIKLKDNPELLLEDSNLICLCRTHHKQADRGNFSVEYLQELVQKRYPPT